MRPSCWSVPAILPPGHHMIVAGASVPSTEPRQMHMSDLISTLVRTIVSSVLSLSLMVILAASLDVAGPPMLGPASLVSAYSTIGAIGAAIMPTPMVDLEDLALSIMVFCLSFMAMPAGALWKTWFQSLPSWVAFAPCCAAAFLTASTFSFGTSHISDLVRVSTWPLALPACLMMRL